MVVKKWKQNFLFVYNMTKIFSHRTCEAHSFYYYYGVLSLLEEI